MRRRDFEAVVRDAIETLPEEFRHVLENLAIVVREEPDEQDLQRLGLEREADELFGLYHGVPLTERGSGCVGLPDRVEIYWGPILRSFDTAGEVMAEIRNTLIHELGHHMGLSDSEMPY
jgi:predicted Zn-dependent protease with MMP-like domain